jgi:hypothetical protein
MPMARTSTAGRGATTVTDVDPLGAALAGGGGAAVIATDGDGDGAGAGASDGVREHAVITQIPTSARGIRDRYLNACRGGQNRAACIHTLASVVTRD